MRKFNWFSPGDHPGRRPFPGGLLPAGGRAGRHGDQGRPRPPPRPDGRPAATTAAATAAATKAAAACRHSPLPLRLPPAAAAASGPNIDRIKKAGKLVVLMDATFRPMEFKDEKGDIVGFDVDMADAFAK